MIMSKKLCLLLFVFILIAINASCGASNYSYVPSNYPQLDENIKTNVEFTLIDENAVEEFKTYTSEKGYLDRNDGIYRYKFGDSIKKDGLELGFDRNITGICEKAYLGYRLGKYQYLAGSIFKNAPIVEIVGSEGDYIWGKIENVTLALPLEGKWHKIYINNCKFSSKLEEAKIIRKPK